MIYIAMMASALLYGAHSQCASVSVSGVPYFPLDECMVTATSAGSVGYKIYCDGDSVMEAYYDNGDCSGTATTESGSSYDANCDGMHAFAAFAAFAAFVLSTHIVVIGTHSHHRYIDI